MKLAPPFEIYHDEIHIGDANGHVCTAESPEIAKQIVEALNTHPPRPDASAEPRVTLDEIATAMDRVLERHGLKAQVDNLERRSAW